MAAVNRAKYVLEKYQRTPSTKDALEIMAQAYDKLGMKDLADDARRVLALAWTRRVRLQRMTLICDRLTYPPAQRLLFAPERRLAEKQDLLMEQLRDDAREAAAKQIAQIEKETEQVARERSTTIISGQAATGDRRW